MMHVISIRSSGSWFLKI